jgi:hypothetical protein
MEVIGETNGQFFFLRFFFSVCPSRCDAAHDLSRACGKLSFAVGIYFGRVPRSGVDSGCSEKVC